MLFAYGIRILLGDKCHVQPHMWSVLCLSKTQELHLNLGCKLYEASMQPNDHDHNIQTLIS